LHGYGQAARSQKGLESVYTLKDESSGELIGLAIWDSEDSYAAARPALLRATEGDDFDSREAKPVRCHRLKPV